MKQHGRTPYEIRLELLQLAFDVLSAKHSADAVAKNGGKICSSPSTEEIIAEADKMNAFISKGSSLST
ncbi:MAG: hypothetical protein N3D72_00610 [Candidatus Methanomethyliaceae archaeon]|nr:hypothetical protein [Candidatus Methanomethyliaceae archaeon]